MQPAPLQATLHVVLEGMHSRCRATVPWDTCTCRSGTRRSGADRSSESATLINCVGACVDLQTNADNCGKCAIACTGGKVCTTGACACGAPPIMECVPGTCTDTSSDPECLPNRPECVPGSKICNDLIKDNNNCGDCGHVCGAGTSCKGGSCK